MTRIFDLSTLVGILLAIGLIMTAVSLGGSPKSFFDPASVLIVIGGTLAITLASFSFREITGMFSLVKHAFSYHHHSATETAVRLIEYGVSMRTEGSSEMQKKVNRENIRMLKQSMNMVIDGVDVSSIEHTLAQSISSRMERHDRSVSVLRKAGEVAPAMGLIGTLIGLVQMLGNLDDPSSIGPAMAVALLTTLYGAILAYVVFLPLASKLERNSREELLIDTLCLKAIGVIGRKENPRRIQVVANTILPPEWRVNYFNDLEGA